MNQPLPGTSAVDEAGSKDKPGLAERLCGILGADDDRVELVVQRSRSVLPDLPVVVWEADPLTFRFTYVSPSVEQLLGYPVSRCTEPDFWKSAMVHPDDLPDALAHCALATAAGADHDFEYRAITATGEVIRVHDVVHVLKGSLGFASRLRGILFPV